MKIHPASTTGPFLIFLIVVFISCSDQSPVRKIQTGNAITVAQKTIPLSGGTIVIDKARDSLDGFRIDIPAGAYGEEKSFQISYAPVTSHEFDPTMKIISPLISIDNGGGYAENAMAVTIPVTVPQGEFAMAYIFEEATGYLEALPRIAANAGSITVATRHFSKIIAVSYKDSEADFYKTYETGFRPGVDDWQMGNQSVYLSVNGQCSGQSIGMVWYYNEKRIKQKAPALYGRFDNDGKDKTPSFWQDDALALKFCSVVHWQDIEKRLDWDNQNLWRYSDQQGEMTDRETMIQFAAAFRANEKPRPQYIKVANEQSAHAMVVYKMSEGDLYIADPNYPGKTDRKIDYDPKTQTYKPYVSGTTYTNVSYFGEFALISFDAVARQWQKLEDGTIARQEFPQYQLMAVDKDGNKFPLASGLKLPDGLLRIAVQPEKVNKHHPLGYTAFDATGNEIDLAQPLPPGKHKIGIRGNAAEVDGVWIGFQWFVVEVPEPGEETIPPPRYGDVTISLKVNGTDVTIQRGNFSIQDGRFHLRNLDVPDIVELSLEAVNWNGTGEYKVTGNIDLHKLAPVQQFSRSAFSEGTLKITEWSEGRLSGTFSFIANYSTGLPAPQDIRVTGQFNYVSSWLKTH